MIRKIIDHIILGDILSVSKNYLNNFLILDRIKAWRRIKATGDPVTIQVQNGQKLKLYPDSVLSESIYIGRFENAELDFVSRYLKKGDVFFDIGANIGLFSVVAAGKIQSTGKVYSFEPVRSTFLRLKENIKLNNLSHVSLYNLGLSNSDGILEMVTSSEGYDAWNSFGKPTAGSNFVNEKVEILKIDSWCQQNQISLVNLAKIDVEGWECNVLKGGEKLFSSSNAPDLIVEFTEENCKNAETTCGQLYDILKDFGYQMFTYDERTKTLVDEPKRLIYTHLNIVATKNIQAIQYRLKQ